jgi:hypothetical protein
MILCITALHITTMSVNVHRLVQHLRKNEYIIILTFSAGVMSTLHELEEKPLIPPDTLKTYMQTEVGRFLVAGAKNPQYVQETVFGYLLNLIHLWNQFAQKSTRHVRVTSNKYLHVKEHVTPGGYTHISNVIMMPRIYGSFVRAMLGVVEDVPPGDIDCFMFDPSIWVDGPIINAFKNFLNEHPGRTWPEYNTVESSTESYAMLHTRLSIHGYAEIHIQLTPRFTLAKFDYSVNQLTVGLGGDVSTLVSMVHPAVVLHHAARFMTVEKVMEHIAQRIAVDISTEHNGYREEKIKRKGYTIVDRV